MRREFKFKTLESRIYIIFLIIIFLIILIMQIVFFKSSSSTVKDSTIKNNRRLLEQLISQIDSYIIEIGDISNKILDDEIIQNFLESDISNKQFEDIELRLQHYLDARLDISNILIYKYGGSSILGNNNTEINPWINITDSDWFHSSQNQDGGMVVSNAHVQNVFLGEYAWVISLSQEILSADGKRPLGVLLVDLKIDKIDELCRSFIVGDKGYDFIIDNMGEYIYHPAQQLVHSNLRTEPVSEILKLLDYNKEYNYYEDNERLFLVETSELTSWNIVSVIYNSDIVTDWKNIQILYIFIGILLFIIIGLSTKYITKGITEPIRKLQRVMNTVENGSFELIGPIQGSDEIRNLAHDYDIMVGKIKELMESNSREHELKRKSDLKALQAQINPHFLYNTLDSIIWMGEMKQHSAVVEMTSALSKLFRISISKGHEIITLKDEIAHVEAYLTIQEMRYKDKFKYTFDIDPKLLSQPMMKITLQPLVENAIYHGIKGGNKQGEIKILSYIEGKKVIIKVKDNGRGMNQETLDKLINSINNDYENRDIEDKQGMGVRNVHQRIRIYFGQEYGLTFSSIYGVGTTITVSVPYLEEEKYI